MLADQMSFLRCPETGSTLAPADAEIIRRLNEEISAGRLQNRGGQIVEKELDGGLICQAGDVVYPIFDGIPVLIKNESISIATGGPFDSPATLMR
jgi:uncharacterized protein YbaR (Trm112 family)